MVEEAGAPAGEEKKEVVTIKKYANRRLYNTATSSYVTLDHLAKMVKDGTDFAVFDAKTGADITRSVLTHIIVEEESKGQHLLPISFLRHLISFYGDSLQAVVPNYLEHSMQAFAHNQEQMRRAVQDAFGGLTPFGKFEEMGKQNMALFENAMKMFSPFYAGGKGANGKVDMPAPAGNAKAPEVPEKRETDIEALKSQLANMQAQLDRMADK
jgi:polyhydroxyalkanoate synthesis repressor PhaR